MATSKTSRFIFSFALALATTFVIACAPDVHDTNDGGEFVAVPSDFADYPSWPSYDLGDGDAGTLGDACAHLANVPRVAFVNKTPPHGSTEFPVGTMIVKQIRTTSDPSTWAVFGMAKRGGEFNPGSGCDAWEWYGLYAPDSGTGFQWSGTQPGGGDPYASCGACSSCHSAAQTNDCVIAPELSLSQW